MIYGEHTLTYQELNREANKVAHCLRKEGVKQEDFVAIIAERSLEMVVGIYRIIKSGAGYVPMDPVCQKSDAKLQELVEVMNKVRVRWFPIDYKDGFDDSVRRRFCKNLLRSCKT